jgi:signal peptidase II
LAQGDIHGLAKVLELPVTPKLKVLLAVLITSLVMDQSTKLWALNTIGGVGGRDIVVVKNWVEFVHAENKGAAWSTFSDSPYRLYVFAVFTIVAVVALIQMFRSLEPGEKLRAASTGLILSGAVGNAIDRTWKGSVTDFIKVFAGEGDARRWCIEHFGTNVWPIFNVADAAIVVGVSLFGLEYFFQKDTAAADKEDVGPNPMQSSENGGA